VNDSLIRHYLSPKVLWCSIRGRHQGEVFYTNEFGPYWECDNCKTTLRG
jgi:hypothetical protein